MNLNMNGRANSSVVRLMVLAISFIYMISFDIFCEGSPLINERSIGINDDELTRTIAATSAPRLPPQQSSRTGVASAPNLTEDVELQRALLRATASLPTTTDTPSSSTAPRISLPDPDDDVEVRMGDGHEPSRGSKRRGQFVCLT